MEKKEEVTNLLITSRLRSTANVAPGPIGATASVLSLLQRVNKKLIVLLFACLSVAAQAAPITVVSTAGGLKKAIEKNGALSYITDLTVTGTIDYRDISILKNMPLVTLNLSGVKIVQYKIPNGGTQPADRLSDLALKNCTNLENLTLPTSLTSIGASTFFGCTGLTGSLNLPAGLTSIGVSAFFGCSGLTGSLTIPSGITSIGTYAFRDCSGFTGSLVIPSNVTSIGMSAFDGCTGLTGSLSIPSTVTSIGENAFNNCINLKDINVGVANPAAITLGNTVFAGVPTATCVLYVPSGSKAAYSAAPQWKDFKIIADDLPVPVVETLSASSTSGTTATVKGNVSRLGSPIATAYGLCWNTTGSMPTTSDQIIDNGVASATGEFTNTLTGLNPASTYYVRAFARNTLGTSYGNMLSFSAITIPNAPIIGTVTPGNRQVSVSFTPSSAACGGTLSYTVTSTPGNLTGTGSASPIIVNGLSNGTYYTFKVTATNSAGTSPASAASNSVAPSLTPQTITFGTMQNHSYGDAPYTINATSTSGLPITYTSDNAAVATVSGNVLTVVGAGTATLTASQAGDATYAATTNTQTITINKAALAITAVADTKTYDGTTTSTAVPTVGTMVAGDAVSTAPTQSYDNANAGDAHVLSVAPVIVKKGAVDVTANYAISYATATGTINKADLTVSAIADTKTYDGTTTSTAVPTVGTAVGADVITTLTQAYDNANAGDTHVLSVSPLTIKNGAVDVTANYAISYATATGTINKANLAVSAVADTKTYDGTTTSTAVPTVGTAIAADVITTPTQAYDNANAGDAHVLSVAPVTIKNGDVDVTANYAISYATATGTIGKANLTISAVNDTKTYDGSTASTAVPTVGTLGAGDVVSIAPIQSYDNANAGDAHVLSVAPVIIKNGDVDMTANYAISYTTATGTINKADLMVSAVSDTKTYDGTTTSTAVPTVGTAVGGDVITTPTQIYDNINAGDHVLSVSPLLIKNGDVDVTANYAISYTTATGTINKADLTVSAIADTKTYDGTTTSTAVPTVGTAVGADVITTPTQAYDNANAGDAHVLSVAPVTIKNGAVDVTANYAISYTTATGTINKANLTVSAVADTKTYDGTTTSTAVPTVGTAVAADVITTPTQAYDNANAGDAHVLSVAPVTIKNGDVDVTGNYAISYATATGTINKANLTISAVNDTKTYDGSTASTAVPTVGTLGAGDVVSIAPIQSYDNANAGDAHVLSVTPVIVKNGDIDMTANYAISYTTATGTINKADLMVSAVSDTKTYDGTTTSTAVPTVGTAVGADVITTPTQAYDNINAGDHVLSVSPLLIKNGDVDVTGNYAISYATATGTINKANLAVSAVADTKTYDGTTTSTAVPTVGTAVATDVITTPTQAYDNANAGDAHVLSVSPLTIKNGAVDVTANYAISYATATGTINKANLAVSAVADTKTYDGTTTSTAVPTVGTLGTGDALAIAPVQSYDNVNVGTTHILSVAPVTIKNGDVDVTANYAISYAAATGTIGKVDLMVSAVADTKTYDGTTTSAAVPTIGLLGTGDALAITPTQSYDNANAGDAHVLSVTPISIRKDDVDVTGNYAISYAAATGVINRAALSASAVADTKTYDGTTTSTAVPTIGTAIAGDVITTPTQAYDNINVGDARVLSVAPLTIKKGDVDVTANYAISYVPATGVINKAALSVSAVADTKTYDGTTASTAVPTVGTAVAADVITTPTQAYDNANAGDAHVLSVSPLTINNGAVDVTANYAISYATATGTISKADLMVSAVADTKTYDGTKVSTAVPTVGPLGTGDAVATTLTQSYDNANVGTTHILSVVPVTIKNGDVDVTANYAISYAAATGTIGKADLTVSAVADTKTYDGTTTSTAVPTVGTLGTGDIVDIAPTQSYDNANAGDAHVLSVTPISIRKDDVDVTANYAINYTTATGAINRAALSASAVADTKTYDGTTASTAIPTVGTAVGGDVITTPTQAYDNINVGDARVLSVAPLTIKKGDVDVTGNYAISYTTATGTIGKATLSVSAVADTKTYDGTTASTVVPTVGTAVGGDVITTPTQVYDNINAGDHVLSVSPLLIKSGDMDVTGNYAISYTTATGTINKANLAVSAVADTKTYDGSTVSAAVPTVGPLGAGDAVATTLTQSYDNANMGTTHVLSVTPLAIKRGAVDVTDNYSISYTEAAGAINAKPLLITDPTVVTSKIYDEKTTAVVSEKGSLQGVVKADAGNVTVNVMANYADAAIGDDKVITVSYTLAGSAAGNYTVPVDFVIRGARIYSSTIVVNSLSEPTVNAQKTGFEVSYSIASGSPTEYKITYNAAALAAGIKNISYTPLSTTGTSGVLSVTLPEGVRPGKYRGTLQLKNEFGNESTPYDFVITVNVSIGYIIVKYNRVLVLNNATKQFETYQWYKDGVAIEGATKQYYRDPEGLVGAYSLKVTTVEGDTLESDIKELNLPLAAKVSGYPSLVKANQAYTVEITDENASLNLAGAELSVYSERGLLVYKTTHVEKVNTIQLPRTQGLYTGRVLTADGDSYQFKVIVAN